MHTSPDEIDLQINETRDDTEQNLDNLEHSDADARLYGRVAAIGLAVLVVAGVGYFLYRRRKRPSLARRLRTRFQDSLRDLPPDLSSRLKKQIPRVKVVLTRRDGAGSGTFEAMARRVTPAVVGGATTAVLEHFTRTPASKRSDAAAD